jgi:hypothetical protein
VNTAPDPEIIENERKWFFASDLEMKVTKVSDQSDKHFGLVILPVSLTV